MKQLPLPYQITKPPQAIRNARMDNIALMPASMLLKGTYQPIADKLPKGGVLICAPGKRPRIQAILSQVAAFFRAHGREVTTLPTSYFAI